MKLDRRTMLKSGAALAAALGAPRLFAQQSDTIRVGALNPVTGVGSPYGSSMQKAILFAADNINAAGGVGGREIQVFAEDTQTSPEAGVLAAKKLIEVNKVQAILGTWSSGVTSAIMPVSDTANVLHATNAGASSVQSTKGLMFRFSGLSARVGEAEARMIADLGHQRLATMAFNNPSGRQIAEGVKKGWEDSGRSLVNEIVYEPNRPSYRSEVQQVLASNPDAIAVGSYLSDFTIIVREARQQGSDVQFFAPAWCVNQQLIDALGDAAEGIMTHDYVPAINSVTFQTFVEEFKSATGIDPSENYYACCAYDMMTCFGLAAEAASLAGTSDVVGNMRAVANEPGTEVTSFAEGKKILAEGGKIDYQGASGPISFDADGNVTPLFKLSKVENGKVVFIKNVFSDY